MYFCTYDEFILFSKSLFLEDNTFLQLQSGIEDQLKVVNNKKVKLLFVYVLWMVSGLSMVVLYSKFF